MSLTPTPMDVDEAVEDAAVVPAAICRQPFAISSSPFLALPKELLETLLDAMDIKSQTNMYHVYAPLKDIVMYLWKSKINLTIWVSNMVFRNLNKRQLSIWTYHVQQSFSSAQPMDLLQIQKHLVIFKPHDDLPSINNARDSPIARDFGLFRVFTQLSQATLAVDLFDYRMRRYLGNLVELYPTISSLKLIILSYSRVSAVNILEEIGSLIGPLVNLKHLTIFNRLPNALDNRTRGNAPGHQVADVHFQIDEAPAQDRVADLRAYSQLEELYLAGLAGTGIERFLTNYLGTRLRRFGVCHEQLETGLAQLVFIPESIATNLTHLAVFSLKSIRKPAQEPLDVTLVETVKERFPNVLYLNNVKIEVEAEGGVKKKAKF